MDRVRELTGRIQVTWHPLSAAEVERASGFTAELQRLWRSRGVLPKKSGTRVSYTAHDAARFCLAKILRSRGTSQTEALELADRYQSLLLHHAMMNADGVVEFTGSPQTSEDVYQRLEADEVLLREISGWDGDEGGTLLISSDGCAFTLQPHPPSWTDIGSPCEVLTINLVTLSVRFANALGRPLVLLQENPGEAVAGPVIRRVFSRGMPNSKVAKPGVHSKVL